MLTNTVVQEAATTLRQVIELGNHEADITYAMSRMVEALGGMPWRVAEWTGRPDIQAAYLVALVLGRQRHE